MGVKFSQLPTATSVASDDYIAVLDSSESILKKTSIDHASTSSAYGPATSTKYGHVKIVDNLTTTSLADGEALSARQGNILANSLGVYESTSTAQKKHPAGDFFLWNGKFVKSTRDIEVGNTIAIGTNVEQVDIGSILSQLNSKISSEVITTTLEVNKWSSKQYSFETEYPSSTYDLTVEPNGDTITSTQLDAWNNANLVGSSTNKIVALGDQPTVAIPVVLKVVDK